jgi:hypothetical protein
MAAHGANKSGLFHPAPRTPHPARHQFHSSTPPPSGFPNEFTYVAETAVTLLILPARAFYMVRKRSMAWLQENLLSVESHRCVTAHHLPLALAPLGSS